MLPEAWTDPGSRFDEALPWADRLAGEPDLALPFTAFLRFFQDGNRQEYEKAYFHRRRRVEIFALAVLSGRGDRFLGPLHNVLWTVCEESTWALPAHVPGPGPNARTTVDLFAAETASALAEIRSLLAHRLDAALVGRIDREIEERVLGPYLQLRPEWSWESATHNWAAVCAGGVGLAALWLVADPGRLGRFLERLGPTFDAYLSGFPADGLCLEGMGYWTYGFGYFVAFAELLKDRSRGRLDLLGDPELGERLRTIAVFPTAGRLGNRDFARFSDALDEYRYPPGVTARLTRRLGAPGPLPPELAETLDYDIYVRWARHLRDLLWTPADSEKGSPAVPAPPQWFPQSQWLVARWGEAPRAIGLAAKGGHNAEPHNHNDVGAFQLVGGDDVLIDDLGAGRYDRDYFGPGRYGYFVTSSASHSVPLIDGRGQNAGPEAAKAVAWNGSDVLTMDLAPVYGVPGLNALVRTWELEAGPSRLGLTDRFDFAGGQAHEITERFVTCLAVRTDTASATIEGSGFSLVIRPAAAPDEVRVVPVVYAPHEGPDRTAFCLDFVYRTNEPTTLRFDLWISHG